MRSHRTSTLFLLYIASLSSACTIASHVKKKDCLHGDCSSFVLSQSGVVRPKPDKLDPLSFRYDYNVLQSEIVSEGMLISLENQKTCQGLHHTVDLYNPIKPKFPSHYAWLGGGVAGLGISFAVGGNVPLVAIGGSALTYGIFETYYYSGKFHYKFPRTESLDFYPCASKEKVVRSNNKNVIYSIFPNGMYNSIGTETPHSIDVHPSQVQYHSSIQLKMIDDSYLIPTHALGYSHFEDPIAPTIRVKPHYDITPQEKEYAPLENSRTTETTTETTSEIPITSETTSENTTENTTENPVTPEIPVTPENSGVEFKLLTPNYVYSTEVISFTAPSPAIREWYCDALSSFSYIKTLDENGLALPVENWKIGFLFPDVVSDITKNEESFQSEKPKHQYAELPWMYKDGTAVFRYHKNTLRKCNNETRMNVWNVASQTLRENPKAYQEVRAALSGISLKTIYVPQSIRQPTRDPLSEMSTSVASNNNTYDNGYRLEERQKKEVQLQKKKVNKKSNSQKTLPVEDPYENRPPYGRYQCSTEGKQATLDIRKDGGFLLMVEMGLGSAYGNCNSRQCTVQGNSGEARAFMGYVNCKITSSNNAILIDNIIHCSKKN